MTDENSDRLWTLRNLFEILNKAFSKLYGPSAHLAVDEVIILFKRRIIFPTIHTQENTNVVVSKFTNYETRLDTRI